MEARTEASTTTSAILDYKVLHICVPPSFSVGRFDPPPILPGSAGLSSWDLHKSRGAPTPKQGRAER